MSKHDKGNVVTKVLSLATIAVIGGTAAATFLPSTNLSGTQSLTSADVLQSVQSLINPTTISAPATAKTATTHTVKKVSKSNAIATSSPKKSTLTP